MHFIALYGVDLQPGLQALQTSQNVLQYIDCRVEVGMGGIVGSLHAAGRPLGRAWLAVMVWRPACDAGGRGCRGWAGVPALSTGHTILCCVCT